MRKFIFSVLLLVLYACSQSEAQKVASPKVSKTGSKDSSNITNKQVKNPVDTALLQQLNLVDVQEINPQIFVDLKYTTVDNFMKMKLYEKIDRAYLLQDVAERLSKAQEMLCKIDPDLHLLIYDALRPVSVQRKMWRALDSIPPKRRGLFVSNPINRSVHNYGAAVDLTICDASGNALDMGAGFDDIREIAYPSKETHYLATGELSEEQVANRKLLRKVMGAQGFTNLPTEWWHFNGVSRSKLGSQYQALMEEF